MSDQQMRRHAENVQTGKPASMAGKASVEEDSIDLLELMYRLIAGWKLIVCLTFVFVLAAGLATEFIITPMYEATATIYVLNRSDSAINMSDLQIGTALTSDYIKVFKMWEVHEEVISNLNLPYSYKDMKDHLTVTNESNTRMLDITFKSASAEEAAAVANEYAKVASQYIADTMATDKPSMMSVALVPANPSSPNLPKNLVLSFLLGLILSCGIITVRMLMDDKYKTAEDIMKYTGMATLALVPLAKNTAAHDEGKSAKRARREA